MRNGIPKGAFDFTIEMGIDMGERVEDIQVFTLSIPRDIPYLGPLEREVNVNEKGYFIRPGNSSIYSTHDHCVLVKATSTNGHVGWGECVSVVAPQVVAAVLHEIVIPLVKGRDPHEVTSIHEMLYDAMRVRGFFGGFYLDALAAMDIALWDLRGKLTDLPLYKLLGGQHHDRIPAYVSGLPGATLEERAKSAKSWTKRGFKALKFAAAVAHEGELAEMKAIRAMVGPEAKILIDMHWRYSAREAVKLICELEAFDLYLAEAPVQSEDIYGQAEVVRAVSTPIGIGEELRTVHEYQPRFIQRCMGIIQPEMGRIGISEFIKICHMAQAFHCPVMPHASIGIGIFQAASLHVSATLPHLAMHEYQHSIFDRNIAFIDGDMRCAAGYFTLPKGPGLGVEPRKEVLSYAI